MRVTDLVPTLTVPFVLGVPKLPHRSGLACRDRVRKRRGRHRTASDAIACLRPPPDAIGRHRTPSDATGSEWQLRFDRLYCTGSVQPTFETRIVRKNTVIIGILRIIPCQCIHRIHAERSRKYQGTNGSCQNYSQLSHGIRTN